MANFGHESLFNDDNGDNIQEFRLKCLYGTNSLLPIINPTIISGDTINVAQRKLTLILTKSTAIKLFGTIDCIGKSLNKNKYQVNAVIEDIPRNNSTYCDAICLVETLNNNWSEWRKSSC